MSLKVQFTITNDTEKLKIITFEKLQPDICHFYASVPATVVVGDVIVVSFSWTYHLRNTLREFLQI